MQAQDYWKSKELYNTISDAIPGFKNIKPGQSISIEDDNGNVSYKVMTVPVNSPLENLRNLADEIVIGNKPDSNITMLAREGAYLALSGVYAVMDVFFKQALEFDLEADQKHDFDLCLSDVKSGEFHWFRANHQQGKLENLLSHRVDFDDKGDVTQTKGVFYRDYYKMFKSEEFKNNFTSLHQNIKG